MSAGCNHNYFKNNSENSIWECSTCDLKIYGHPWFERSGKKANIHDLLTGNETKLVNALNELSKFKAAYEVLKEANDVAFQMVKMKPELWGSIIYKRAREAKAKCEEILG